MDIEPDPPQRPRRVSVDVLLVICAMTLLGAHVLLWFDFRDWGQTQWKVDLVQEHVETFLYGPTVVAIVLLAVSLVVRSRRP